MKFVVLAFVVGCLFTATTSVAKLAPLANKSTKVVMPQLSASKGISAKQAANIVKQKYGGKVLNVTTLKDKSGYKVKLLKDNGHIISVFVNGKTGKIKG